MPLGMLAEMAADAWPDRIAVGSRNPDSGTPALTYGALLRAAQGGSGVLQAGGADSVAFLDVNGPAYATVLFAAALAGVPFCPLNYRLSADRLAEQLAALADPLIVAGPDYQAVLAGLGGRVVTVQDWEREADAAEPVGEGSADDSAPCVLLFTSGTSAKPKAAVLRHENLVNYVLQTVEFGAAGADGRHAGRRAAVPCGGSEQHADQYLCWPQAGAPAQLQPRRLAADGARGGNH